MSRLDDARLPRAEANVAREDRALMTYRNCDAIFLRNEVSAPEKGSLACPECGSRDFGDVPADPD